MTPLMHTAKNGNYLALSALLEVNANMDVANPQDDGATALDYARAENKTKCIKILEKAQTLPNSAAATAASAPRAGKVSTTGVFPGQEAKGKRKSKADKTRMEAEAAKTINTFASLGDDASPPRADSGHELSSSEDMEVTVATSGGSKDDRSLEHEGDAEEVLPPVPTTTPGKKKSRVKKQKASKHDDTNGGSAEEHALDFTWTWEGQVAGVESWHVVMLTLLVLLLAHLTRDIVVYMHKGNLITMGGSGETVVRTVMGATGMVAINLSMVILFPVTFPITRSVQ
jgi:hypothetical protein